MGSYGIEIAEAGDALSVGSTVVQIGEHLFNSGFGKAVRIDGFDGCDSGWGRSRETHRRWRCC